MSEHDAEIRPLTQAELDALRYRADCNPTVSDEDAYRLLGEVDRLQAEKGEAEKALSGINARPFVYLRCAHGHEWIAEENTGQAEKGCPWCVATDGDCRRIMAREEMLIRLAAEKERDLAKAALARAEEIVRELSEDVQEQGHWLAAERKLAHDRGEALRPLAEKTEMVGHGIIQTCRLCSAEQVVSEEYAQTGLPPLPHDDNCLLASKPSPTDAVKEKLK